MQSIRDKDSDACERMVRAIAAELAKGGHSLDGEAVERFIADKIRTGWTIRGDPIRDPAKVLLGFCEHYKQDVARGEAKAEAKGEIEVLRRAFRAARKRGAWSECSQIVSKVAEVLDQSGELDACGGWTNEFIIQHERDRYTIDGRAISFIDRALVAFCERLESDRSG